MGFWDGSGISWTVCKQSAPSSRQITRPTPHQSIYTRRMLFLTPRQQCRSTEGKCETCLICKTWSDATLWSEHKVPDQVASTFVQMWTKPIRREWRRSLGQYDNHHGPNTENFFLRLPVMWDRRSEMWFKTFCISISFQTLVSDYSLRLCWLLMLCLVMFNKLFDVALGLL